ncbi:Zinc_finger domain-containing protein [Hexamita inflata]|uniref:Zinc finger domain-containing protein n=1 Tax=Hexamita inflata TaxID=28002 RepID=A0AA86Q5H3_9EUKA|nr:Zinc finger domain-containing protein [Hexamita inflata]
MLLQNYGVNNYVWVSQMLSFIVGIIFVRCEVEILTSLTLFRFNKINNIKQTSQLNQSSTAYLLKQLFNQLAQKYNRTYEETLQELQDKEAERVKTLNYSEKICDHFIAACRDGTIGFGWVCPNDKQFNHCQYRHWIPVDFQLFKKEDMDEDLDYEELEDMIERQRQAITQGTPVTAETFAIWKAKRVAKAKEEKDREDQLREQEGIFSGRQIFEKGLYRKDMEELDEGTADDDFMQKWKDEQKAKKEQEMQIEREEAARIEKENEEKEKEAQQEAKEEPQEEQM